MDVIKEYMNKLNLKQKEIPKRIKEKEIEEVYIPYEEITKDLNNNRVKIAYKMNKKVFNMKDDILKNYIGIILSNNLSSSSKLFEKYKLKDIAININTGVSIVDDSLIITIDGITNNPDLFIKSIQKDIKKLKINKLDFERKKKGYLKSYIMDFDNIEDIEYNISISLMLDNKINYKEYSDINNMSYEIANRIIKLFNFNNECVIKTVK